MLTHTVMSLMQSNAYRSCCNALLPSMLLIHRMPVTTGRFFFATRLHSCTTATSAPNSERDETNSWVAILPAYSRNTCCSKGSPCLSARNNPQAFRRLLHHTPDGPTCNHRTPKKWACEPPHLLMIRFQAAMLEEGLGCVVVPVVPATNPMSTASTSRSAIDGEHLASQVVVFKGADSRA